jgi:NADPH2:quinone reductase
MALALVLHEFKQYGDFSGIHLDDIPLKEPGQGEVRIKVEAFSLNYGDFELFANHYTFGLTLPARIGGECSGVIDAMGPGVSGFQIGDKVSTLPMFYDGFGVNGEFAIFPASNVAKYPDNLSPEEACCIWVAYLTAYFAFMEVAKVTAEDYVLITAASSSAGMAAMDLCRMVGAKTIGTSRTGEKRPYLLESGFDLVIAQDEGDMSAKVMDCTDGRGVRVIYDPIGGKIVQDYADALAQNAMILLYGGMDQSPTIVPEIEMTRKAAWLHAFSTFNHIEDKDSLWRGVNFVHAALERGDIKPAVGKVYPLKAYREALEDQLQSGARRGKIVIKP